jgi:hypothetical protein
VRERAVRLGERRVDAGVLPADLAQGIAEPADVATEGGEAKVSALRAIAADQGADERPAECERRLDDVEERELGERRDGAVASHRGVALERPGADGERCGRDVGSDGAQTDHRAAGVDPREEGLAALPRVEGPACEVEHSLGEEEGVHLAEIYAAPADLGAHATANEERVEIGALDGGLERRGHGGPGAHRELGRERDRRVAVEVDRDRRGSGDLAAEVGLRGASALEHPPHLGELERHRRARRVASNGRVEGVHDAGAHLLEDDRAVVDEDRGLRAAAIDAQRRGVGEALDAELPRVLVEAHDALSAGDADEVGEGPREVAQHARRMTLRDTGGDVCPVDEEVEDLVGPHAGARRGRTAIGALPAARLRTGGDGSPRSARVIGQLGKLWLDEDFEASHSSRATDSEGSVMPVRFCAGKRSVGERILGSYAQQT